MPRKKKYHKPFFITLSLSIKGSVQGYSKNTLNDFPYSSFLILLHAKTRWSDCTALLQALWWVSHFDNIQSFL